MNKIAALGVIVVFLVVGSIALSTIMIPVSAQAAPQSTPPAKPNVHGGGLPANVSPQISAPQTDPSIPLLEGQAMVIVQLDALPLAAIFQQAYQETNSYGDAMEAMRSGRKTLNDFRQSLIAQLTAPPFNARIISATSIVSNTLIIEVDASLIPQISALPGVLSARTDRIGQLSRESQSPGQPNVPDLRQPGFGPVLD